MDVANYLEVWAPGGPGSAVKATVAAGATSAAVQIRAALVDAGGFVIQQPPMFVTLKASSSAGPTAVEGGFHLAFGDAGVGAPTDADIVLQDADGWVRVMLPANVTHIRIKSTAAAGSAGSVYVYISGKQG